MTPVVSNNNCHHQTATDDNCDRTDQLIKLRPVTNHHSPTASINISYTVHSSSGFGQQHMLWFSAWQVTVCRPRLFVAEQASIQHQQPCLQ
mmetsp:Transcript_46478/g.83058  ORF Transcript_46478/g.83058 Transcript_46478/m.83058 type:complete len:91 (-) Transcript_46478:1845-2117(-)